MNFFQQRNVMQDSLNKKEIYKRNEVKIMHEKEIAVKMQKLPDDLKREVLDYIDFLLSKSQDRKTARKKFKFDWEGGLSELKEDFTSVELQHRALEWR